MGVRGLSEQDPGQTHSENRNFVPKTGSLFRKREAGMDGKVYRRDEEKGGTNRKPQGGGQPAEALWKERRLEIGALVDQPPRERGGGRWWDSKKTRGASRRWCRSRKRAIHWP
jgi:hypothetical protein